MENQGLSTANAKALWTIYKESSDIIARDHRIPFGESNSVHRNSAAPNYIDKASKSKIVSTIANVAFGDDVRKVAESKGIKTKEGVLGAYNESLVFDLKNEYKARAENFDAGGAVNGQYANINIQNMQRLNELGLVCLVDGVIQPIYNKVFKTFVSPVQQFKRPWVVDFVYDDEAKIHIPLKEYRQNPDLIDRLSGTITPLIEVTMAATNGLINDNVFTEYNALPGVTPVPTEFNFARNPVNIVEVTYTKGSNPAVTEGILVRPIQTATQTLQTIGNIASYNIQFYLKDANGAITDIVVGDGSITQKGDLHIQFTGTDLVGSDNVVINSVKVSFRLPMLGNNKSRQVYSYKLEDMAYITYHDNFNTTFSQYFQDEYKEKTGEPLLETWTDTVTRTCTYNKDNYAIKFLVNKYEELKVSGALSLNNFHHRVRKGFTNTVDMNIADPGLTDYVTGVANTLGLGLNDMLTKMHLELLQDDNTAVLVSSRDTGVYFKNSDNTHNAGVKYIGSLSQEVAGISLPYELMRIAYGTYAGYYIASDDARFSTTVKTGHTFVDPNTGTSVTKDVPQHNIYVVPRPEDNKDTYTFLHGKEYLEHTTGTAEVGRDPSINYHLSYDMYEVNNLLGKVELLLKPQG